MPYPSLIDHLMAITGAQKSSIELIQTAEKDHEKFIKFTLLDQSGNIITGSIQAIVHPIYMEYFYQIQSPSD